MSDQTESTYLLSEPRIPCLGDQFVHQNCSAVCLQLEISTYKMHSLGVEQGHIIRHSTCLTSDKQMNKCGHGSVGRLATTRLLTGRPIFYLFSSCGVHQAGYSMGIWGLGSGTEYSPSLELKLRMSGAMPLPPYTFMGYTRTTLCMQTVTCATLLLIFVSLYRKYTEE